MYCSNCGKKISDDANYCPYCSHPVAYEETEYVYEEEETQQPPVRVNKGGKSKLVAGLLNVFLPFGVGRLYAGYVGIGVCQLLLSLFSCGIVGLWSFIDGILILTGTPSTDGAGMPWSD